MVVFRLAEQDEDVYPVIVDIVSTHLAQKLSYTGLREYDASLNLLESVAPICAW